MDGEGASREEFLEGTGLHKRSAEGWEEANISSLDVPWSVPTAQRVACIRIHCVSHQGDGRDVPAISRTEAAAEPENNPAPAGAMPTSLVTQQQ